MVSRLIGLILPEAYHPELGDVPLILLFDLLSVSNMVQICKGKPVIIIIAYLLIFHFNFVGGIAVLLSCNAKTFRLH